jgi:hypothetical protein
MTIKLNGEYSGSNAETPSREDKPSSPPRRNKMDEQAPDRSKIVAKIKKCLALGKSSEPHEAAAAMRQAQKMMQAHGITEGEVDGLDVGHAVGSFKERAKRQAPTYAQHLATLVSRAMGVKAVFEERLTGKHVRWAVRYFGCHGRAEMAAWCHEVLMRAMAQAYKEYQDQQDELTRAIRSVHRGGMPKLGFFVGWIASVQQQVERFGFPEEEEKKLDLVKAEYYGKSLTPNKTRTRSVSQDALDAGRAAGASFRLHRPMDGAPRKLLGHS